jgi:hypothetical protein
MVLTYFLNTIIIIIIIDTIIKLQLGWHSVAVVQYTEYRGQSTHNIIFTIHINYNVIILSCDEYYSKQFIKIIFLLQVQSVDIAAFNKV